ncbi:hypothetical protein GGR56DRAFT_676032 [Xylariaceae sp. FL0804]|nr:hypothetical protein GGR56DRAFT_676032 [Xylariaceae sp. FL0804]
MHHAVDLVLGMGSKQVPPGIIGFFGLMRWRGIWGADADVFRIERCFEAGLAELRLMNVVVVLIFGCHRDQCLGKTIAVMEPNEIFVKEEYLSCLAWS